MFHNDLCERLDIKYPLLQGAMAWIAGGRLAAAVSEAGGLGVIGAAGADSAWMQREIKKARELTSRPFGINLMLASSNVEMQIDTVIQENVPIVTTGAGNPGKYMDRLKSAGIKVIPVVSSVALAKRMARLGVDALIAEGAESGGHIGDMSTMCLVPMVVDAVEVPVIAAGGIADGRGFVAALALGASGVQVGTRFICAEECDVHPNYQQKIIKARDRSTVVCGASTGHPVRAIHNSFTWLISSSEKDGASKEELERMGRGRYPRAAVDGDVEEGTVMAGQICGLVSKIQPAAVIASEIMAEAGQVKKRLGGC